MMLGRAREGPGMLNTEVVKHEENIPSVNRVLLYRDKLVDTLLLGCISCASTVDIEATTQGVYVGWRRAHIVLL